MPQKTNLNINPFFDDFDKDDNFYRVLFKPGFPIQARELTQLQSILQNQVESFGSHMFKEGSMVIPGNINYNDSYSAVKINPDHLGIDVTVYTKQLHGKSIRGQSSGVVATIDDCRFPTDGPEYTDITLYVNYSTSGTDNEASSFEDGEILILEDTITYGNTTISSGETIASLVSENATATSSIVSVGEGVFFVRGTFVNVQKSGIILDPYSNNSSYRVGLTILEEIVSAKDDKSLYDNAKGFSNFAAPGADRLKISATLSKKALNDYDDKTFVELVRISNGELKKLQNKSEYNLIRDYFAKRTFDESGNYALENFEVEINESLNDRRSNEGVYFEGQQTEQGNTPSEDLMAVKISAGTAYVKGYDIDKVGTTVIDVEKPRDILKIDSSQVPFEFGTKFKLNNVTGTPQIGAATTFTIGLYDKRRTSATTPPGTTTQIGEARVYMHNLSDASYSNASTEHDLYVFDVQTFVGLTINTALSPLECPAASFVRGKSSGATGFVQTTVNNTTAVTLTQTSGTFISGEQILINGDESLVRSIQSVKTNSIRDVKSVYQGTSGVTGFAVNFIGDVVLQKTAISGIGVVDQVQIATNGVVTGKSDVITGLRVGDIVKYPVAGQAVESFNRVESVGVTTAKVEAVDPVSGVCVGALPSAAVQTNLIVGSPIVSENGGLFAPVGSDNVSTVNLGSSNLIVSKQVTGQTVNSVTGALSIPITNASIGLTSALFETFDAERYYVAYSNGDIEDLTSDQVTLGSGGATVNFTGLTAGASNVVVNVTAKKIGIQSKKKEYIRSEKLTVNGTVSAASTASSGLTTSTYMGLRVQDDTISLNLPDVVEVIAVYESLDTSAPTLDSITLPSGLNLDTSSILGEKIVGSSSGALAQVVTRSSATKVEIVYLNSSKFVVGEICTFEESSITSVVQVVSKGNFQDITSNYTLDKGQRDQFYDYSRIRRSNDYIPSRQLLVIFNYFEVPSSDTGDVFTVESYPSESFKLDIPDTDSGIRISDTLDFRPRVGRFNATNTSPFAFSSRDFSAATNPSLTVTPQESSLIGYEHYLPRVDKVVLNKDGVIDVVKGVSSVNPKEPAGIDESMHIATITLPAYLYDVKDATIKAVDNRRYTMRDIGKLEDRIETLEETTSLSLLELDTKTFQVRDADNLDRFKSGFFVDDFRDSARLDPSTKGFVVTDLAEFTTAVDLYTIAPQPALEPSINVDTADFQSNLELLDSNVQKTGNHITLKYTEADWITQPLASRVENVNPFSMIEFIGNISLNPESDSWTRTVVTESTNVRTVIGRPIVLRARTRIPRRNDRIRTRRRGWFRRLLFGRGGGSRPHPGLDVGGGDRLFQEDIRGNRAFSRSFVETVEGPTIPDTHIRSRNVAFDASNLRPLQRHYAFFDNTSGIDIVPKLIEITMTSGSFVIGETVKGFIGSRHVFSARAYAPNHKTGPAGSPTTTYSLNPYDRSVELPSVYSSSSTILNVDINSLVDEVIGRYFGFVTEGMTLLGETSGSQATVASIKLIPDTFGDLSGAFFFRDPFSTPLPPLRFSVGTKTFKLTSSSTNATPLPGSLLISSGETTYEANGLINQLQRQRVNVFRPIRRLPRRRRTGNDPLAQSFTVDETGAFLSSVDLFFANVDPSTKCTIEIRDVTLGTPTDSMIADHARVVLEPSQINTSTDGTVPTKVTFPSPIYLEPEREYAIVALAPTSNLYEMWVARMGERTVNTTTLPDAESVLVTKQYVGGSLFKSQNGSIWTASQFEDMKFKLYKCNFTTESGTAFFYNPKQELDSASSELRSDPIKTLPRKLKVVISNTTVMNNILIPGAKVSDETASTAISGIVEKAGGTANAMTKTNVGVGYSQGTYAAVPLYNITGSGTGATATIVINAQGTINADPSSISGGSGYVIGDVLGLTTSTMVKGSGAQITVTGLSNRNTLYLTNVQGTDFTASRPLVVYNGSSAVAMAGTTITSSDVINDLYTGNVIEVSQQSHGMHADTNVVKLSGIEPNSVPTTISAAFGLNDNTVSVADTTIFGTQEGISTGAGYAQINGEIIYYTSITAGVSPAGSLGIGSRGVDSIQQAHLVDTQIFPYELNGIGLHRINNQTHTLPNSALLRSERDLDKYHIQILRGDVTNPDEVPSFTDENQIGGSNARGSRNIQFNRLTPVFDVITPGEGSTVSGAIRTISGTSSGGSEISFIDQGFESIALNEDNELTTPRIVASDINETTKLTSLPKNKSFTLGLTLTTEDSNLSPMINIVDNAAIVLGRSALNNPIENYAFDGRVNLTQDDPHASNYISQTVTLDQPATSLKVLVSAFRDSSADFRVLYKLFRTDSSNIEQTFELFPGFDNMTDSDGDGFGDRIINPINNSGRPDSNIPASGDDEFFDYQFSIDELEQFNGFQIKIVMSGTNEAKPPRFKDLRVIALA